MKRSIVGTGLVAFAALPAMAVENGSWTGHQVTEVSVQRKGEEKVESSDFEPIATLVTSAATARVGSGIPGITYGMKPRVPGRLSKAVMPADREAILAETASVLAYVSGTTVTVKSVKVKGFVRCSHGSNEAVLEILVKWKGEIPAEQIGTDDPAPAKGSILTAFAGQAT
ncbi:MAG: hypothetical protein HMLKMBBP_03366 [Planctomycetes bacterium]|nr:hypothetical protein [Planctomycetota bacterium]